MKRNLTELPCLKYLNECFLYNPLTGKLFWKLRPIYHFKNLTSYKSWNTKYSGKEAFTYVDRKGYKVGRLNSKDFRAHRIIYKMIFDCEPECIDHINGKPADNRAVNLRDVSDAENKRNMKKYKNNTSGVVGVSWYKAKSLWKASIKENKIEKHLGYFKNLQDAVDARKKAEVEYGYHINHGRDNQERQE